MYFSNALRLCVLALFIESKYWCLESQQIPFVSLRYENRSECNKGEFLSSNYISSYTKESLYLLKFLFPCQDQPCSTGRHCLNLSFAKSFIPSFIHSLTSYSFTCEPTSQLLTIFVGNAKLRISDFKVPRV